MSLNDSYELFELGKQEALDWLAQEVAGLRTGRVKPDLITGIQVEHYGTRNPLQSLASVSSLDARTLAVSPFDPSSIQAIEKALTDADLGVNPSVDGEVIRLAFPSLTEEIREQTVKQLHKKAEEARVRLRLSRDEALKAVRDEKEKGELTEDDYFNGREKLDRLIGDASKEIEGIVAKKEEEVKTV